MERVLSYTATIATGVFSILMFVVMIFNLLSGLVGGIWLAILGEWGSIIGGIGASIVMPWIWIIVSLPAMLFGFIAAFCAEKGSKTFTAITGFFTSLYNNALLAGWILLVWISFMKGVTPKNYIPHML